MTDSLLVAHRGSYTNDYAKYPTSKHASPKF
jgi:hypothetical protein